MRFRLSSAVSRRVLVLLSLCVLAACRPAQAQSPPSERLVEAMLELRVHAGLRAPALDGLEEWQNIQREALRAQNIPVEAVESFPHRPNVRAEALLLRVGDAYFGIGGGYESTGGRLHYGDYSGEAAFDQIVSRVHGGLFAEHPFEHLLGGGIRAGIVPGLFARYTQTSAEVESLLRLGEGEQQREERKAVDFSARAYSAEPRLALELRRGVFALRVQGSYEFMFGGVLKQEDRAVRLQGQDDDLRADWSGARVGLALGVRLQ